MYSARTAELASAEPVSGRRRPPAMLGASIVVALGIVAASAYGLLAPDPYRSLPDGGPPPRSTSGPGPARGGTLVPGRTGAGPCQRNPANPRLEPVDSGGARQ